MKHELLILRHGKSDWGVDVDDFHRPLKDRGKRAAQRVGVWMLEQDLLPDYVVSSPAERALVTAEKACKAMGRGERMIQRDQRIYDADLSELLGVVREFPASAHRVLIVGHNPSLEMLLGYMAADCVPESEDDKLLPTATLARLSLDCDWPQLDRFGARLLSLTRPDSLPKGFPFPGPGGGELRPRPAYYYTQSSVIPYRVRGGKPQILVILSSRKKHLVIPKGIKEPGLDPMQSAAREALEEAGVEGTVGREPIGIYSYDKWGGTCNVEVFPMEVTRELPEEEWVEHHRGREWVTPEAAIEGLKEQALGPMVRRLVERLGM